MPEKIPYVAVLGGIEGLGRAIAEEHLKRGERVLALGRHAKISIPGEGRWKPDGPIPMWLELEVDLRALHFVNNAFVEIDRLYNDRYGLVCRRLYWVDDPPEAEPFKSLKGPDFAQMFNQRLANGLYFIQRMLNAPHRGDMPLQIVVTSYDITKPLDYHHSLAVYAACAAGQVAFTRMFSEIDRVGSRVRTALLLLPEGEIVQPYRAEAAKARASVIVDEADAQQGGYLERRL